MKVCLFGDAQSVHVQRLAAGLAGRGHTVHVVTHKAAEIAGVSVERFRVPGAGITNLRRWHGRRARYLARFLRDFDVVNVHFLTDWGFTPEIMAEGCLVATAWGSDVVSPPGEDEPPRELIEARVTLLRHATAVTACGPSFAAVVARFGGMAPAEVTVVPFGVDTDLFCPVGRQGQEEQPVVGFFKGFRPVYGARYLIEAIPAVLAAVPRARFELVGDGPELDACHELAARLGVANAVRWWPCRPHAEMPALLGRWSVSVIPSLAEAFGVAALESQACRVPVVASDVCGLRDTVVDGETGLLVAPGSSESIAEGVIRLLRDGGLRRSLGDAGVRWVRERYREAEALAAWESLYAGVAEKQVVGAV